MRRSKTGRGASDALPASEQHGSARNGWIAPSPKKILRIDKLFKRRCVFIRRRVSFARSLVSTDISDGAHDQECRRRFKNVAKNAARMFKAAVSATSSHESIHRRPLLISRSRGGKSGLAVMLVIKPRAHSIQAGTGTPCLQSFIRLDSGIPERLVRGPADAMVLFPTWNCRTKAKDSA